MELERIVVVGELTDNRLGQAVSDLFDKYNKRVPRKTFETELGQFGEGVILLLDERFKDKREPEIKEVYNGNIYPRDANFVYKNFFEARRPK